MPALVKSRFGESGIRLDEGTIVCCFSRKNSRKEVRISALVMRGFQSAQPGRGVKRLGAVESWSSGDDTDEHRFAFTSETPAGDLEFRSLAKLALHP